MLRMKLMKFSLIYFFLSKILQINHMPKDIILIYSIVIDITSFMQSGLHITHCFC